MNTTRRGFLQLGGLGVAGALGVAAFGQRTAAATPISSHAQRPNRRQFRPDPIRGVNSVNESSFFKAREQFNANAVRCMLRPQTTAKNSKVSVEQAWLFELGSLRSFVESAAKLGLRVIVDLHQPPNPDGVSATTAGFWANAANLDIMIAAWRDLVQCVAPYRRYIWGYDLLNEPLNVGTSRTTWPSWAQEVTDDIRRSDGETPIVFEPVGGAVPKAFREDAAPFALIDDPAVVYSVHMYEPHPYTLQGNAYHNNAPTSDDWPGKCSYPGVIGGQYWDKDALRAELQPVVDIQEKYNVPIYVGEFGVLRWAPGAASYLRDCMELFSEYDWDWTFEAFGGFHGFEVEYTSQMTSDANQDAAKATSPTDRELILKAYFADNTFLPTNTSAEPNLIHNGGFEHDSDDDGLADWWSKGSLAATTLIEVGGIAAQQVETTGPGSGIEQFWIQNVSEQNRYRLSARIRVDAGSVRFWHYDVSRAYSPVHSETVIDLGATSGEFVTATLDFSPAPGAIRSSIRFWANSAARFVVQDVRLIDLGFAPVPDPPTTWAAATPSGRVHFRARARRGTTVERSEYRTVGSGADWVIVPKQGLKLDPGGHDVVGYRSVDSTEVVEPAKALVVGRWRKHPWE